MLKLLDISFDWALGKFEPESNWSLNQSASTIGSSSTTRCLDMSKGVASLPHPFANCLPELKSIALLMVSSFLDGYHFRTYYPVFLPTFRCSMIVLEKLFDD
ncbi:hypothetical protein KQX54_016387 [Cotesia glomerata]|uniref:Uncharacterized protein n=1 Tax=Cotesia glomerata TaxID=32391 RepID=A0AAV7IZ57_COTGL|nr:hypothetical protein KQX54_016387 [Cotesia glomerata]